MKFSYPLIKKIIPGVKSKRELVEALTMHSFEAEDLGGGVFDVALPPNRYSDAASHWGLAREVAAVLNLKKINIPARSLNLRESDFAKIHVKVADKKNCARYSIQCFDGVAVEESPLWMQKTLEDCGLRPINNVVDIMNYVMLETGQPLHAFDYDKLEGKHRGMKNIVVRRAKKGERLVSLDKAQYFLTPEMLVIADARRSLAIAGIKGGISAEVTQKTKRIVVESANFDASSIYKTSRVLNLRTDASQRFSHNLSPHLAALGLERAAQLLHELAGARAGLHADLLSRSLPRPKIIIEFEKVSKLLGVEVSRQEFLEILGRLGFTLRETKDKRGKKYFECNASPFRTDILTAEDVIEEVARIYGYQKIKPTPPFVMLRTPESNEAMEIQQAAKSFLTAAGFDEVYNYSFLGPSDQQPTTSDKGSELVAIENPMSNDFSCLRNSLVPGLLKNIDHNKKFFDEAKIFEIGRVFSPKRQKKSEGIEEEVAIAFGAFGKKNDFFFVKGVVLVLLEGLVPGEIIFKEIKDDGASLGVWGFGEFLGIVRRFEGASVAELRIGKLAGLQRKEKTYQEIPKFPSVYRDISFLVSAKEKVGVVMDGARAAGGRFARSLHLIDEYRGDKWPGLQSLTFRITFMADDRTLTGEEVDRDMKRISDLLTKKFKAKLR